MFTGAFVESRESRQRPVSGQDVRVDYSGYMEFYARRAVWAVVGLNCT